MFQYYPFFKNEGENTCQPHDWVLFFEYEAELEADIKARQLGRKERSPAFCVYDSDEDFENHLLTFNFDDEETFSFENFQLQNGEEEVPEYDPPEYYFFADDETEYDIDEFMESLSEEEFRLIDEHMRPSDNQDSEFRIQNGETCIIFPGTLIIQECEHELDQWFKNRELGLQFGESTFSDFSVEDLTKIITSKFSKEEMLKHDWIFNLIENSLLMWQDFIDIYSDFSKSGKFPTSRLIKKALAFYKMNSKHSIVYSLSYNDQIRDLISKLDFSCEEDSLEMQSLEEACNSTQDFFNFYAKIKGTKTYKKLYKLYLYSLSMSLFESFGLTFSTMGYSKFEEETIKRKYHLGTDFFITMIDTLSFLFQKGMAIIRSGNTDIIFHGPEEYAKWYDHVAVLKRQSNLLANPEAHDFDEHSYRDQLDSVIERGLTIQKFAMDLDMSEKRYVTSLMNDLQMLRCEITTKRAAREQRRPPFSVLISGESGIGKSSIKELLFHHYAKIMNLDSDATFCFTRNPAAKYWDGFSTSQWCIILDDVAFMHPNKAQQGDPSCMEFLQIINAVPYVPDQADLSDKGRTPLRAKLCIATTNTEHLNAHYYFSCASAAQRRFPYIIVPQVKEEFKTNNMLDSAKAVTPAGEYPDFWYWTIKKVIPQTTGLGVPAKVEIVNTFSNVYDFMDWYTDAVHKFNSNQETVENSISNLKSIELCMSCNRPTTICQCELQNGLVLAGASAWLMNFMFIGWWQDFFLRMWEQTGLGLFVGVASWLSTFMNLHQLKRWHDFQRSKVMTLGEKIKSQFTPQNAAIAVSVIGIIAVLYKAFKKDAEELQGISESKGVNPTANEDERENVWYNNSYELSKFDLSDKITSSKSIPESRFIDILKMNVVNITVPKPTDASRRIVGVGYCLKGQLYFTNNHNIPEGPETHEITMTYQSRKDGITENLTFTLSESQITRIVEYDICVIRVTNLPPRRGVYEYIPNCSISPKLNGFMLGRETDGSTSLRQCTRLRHVPNSQIQLLKTFKGDYVQALTDFKTKGGDCGSGLVGRSEMGFIFLGIHMIGNTNGNDIYTIKLNKSIFSEVLGEGTYTIQTAEPMLNASTTNHVIGDLHHKSVFRYMDNGSAAVYGSLQGFRQQPKTTVEISPMAHFLSEEGYKIKYGPPVMRGWEPWRIAAVDMVRPVVEINSTIVDECANAYLEDILSNIDLDALKQLEVYDDFTAINGAAGVAYVDKMNRNTSMGWPHKKGKKFFMENIPEERGMQHPVKFDEETMDRVNSMLQNYIDGKRAMPIFTGHLKDEPVSFKKIKMKKTRVFTGAPADWTIIVRKYLLSSIRLIQNNKYAFEAGPGTVAQSYEWHQMYEYITKHGEDRIVAGDYKSFDKRMSPVFIIKAFEILKSLCAKSGNYTQEDLRVIDGIAIDTAFPLVDFNGDIVQFYGSNPSGHPLTVIINSIVNSLYIRYAYRLMNPGEEVSSFKQNVSLMTYGDDNIMSISDRTPWFHHTSIANALGQIGITYTMADKEAESVPYINIKDASFLKREWRLDIDVGAYLAPLDHDSIEKMLMVWTKSKTISQEEQCIAVISSAMREYFFYGKEIYMTKQALLKKLVQHIDIEDWVYQSTFPSFDTLKKEFWDNSRRLGVMPNV